MWKIWGLLRSREGRQLRFPGDHPLQSSRSPVRTQGGAGPGQRADPFVIASRRRRVHCWSLGENGKGPHTPERNQDPERRERALGGGPQALRLGQPRGPVVLARRRLGADVPARAPGVE